MSLHFIESCESTNDEVLKFSKNSLQAVYTFNQTAGRGQYGNQWISEPGKNLAISFSVPAERVLLSPILFNFYTATVLRSFTANLANDNVKIKWPNDLILQNKKIGGLLIEHFATGAKNFYVVGFGLNVNQEKFAFPQAGSLFTQSGQAFDLNNIASQIFAFVEENLLKAPLQEEILREFEKHLFRKDEIAVFQHKNKRQNGIIKNIDAEGFIWIELEEDGLQRFFHKEIEMLY